MIETFLFLVQFKGVEQEERRRRKKKEDVKDWRER
jgi:hypothetical protein